MEKVTTTDVADKLFMGEVNMGVSTRSIAVSEDEETKEQL
jgi:hypothetical protein